MLRTFAPARPERTLIYDVVGIAAFTALTAVSARISIPMEPVPFTLQPLAVLLSGLVLGARGGALSQLAYVLLIAAGLPIDANMRGAAALVGPTAGYLIGFIPAAFVAGLLAEYGRRSIALRFVAGIAGIAVIYGLGLLVLASVTGRPWDWLWLNGAAPFLGPDIAKAIIAASLAEGGRALLMRMRP